MPPRGGRSDSRRARDEQMTESRRRGGVSDDRAEEQGRNVGDERSEANEAKRAGGSRKGARKAGGSRKSTGGGRKTSSRAAGSRKAGGSRKKTARKSARAAAGRTAAARAGGRKAAARKTGRSTKKTARSAAGRSRQAAGGGATGTRTTPRGRTAGAAPAVAAEREDEFARRDEDLMGGEDLDLEGDVGEVDGDLDEEV